MAKFQQGNGGRPKGARNKMPRLLKDMMLQALSDAGGVAYFQRQAEKNPVAFMALLGKILPTQIAAESAPEMLGTRRVIIEIDDRQAGQVGTSERSRAGIARPESVATS